MKIAGIINSSLVNGKGMRTVIFTTGCKHACEGCHALELQDFNYGVDMTVDEIMDKLRVNMVLNDGITISGGDPFCKPLELMELLEAIKKEFPDKSIWVYTGYVYEELIGDTNTQILKLIDVLVDGKFEKDKTKDAKKYTGSSNQRILKLVNGSIVK